MPERPKSSAKWDFIILAVVFACMIGLTVLAAPILSYQQTFHGE